MKWQPIETCPEGTRVWVSAWWEDDGDAKVRVQSYRWTDQNESELMSETTHENYKRLIYHNRVKRKRQWNDGCDYQWWMPLEVFPPPIPAEE